MDTSQALGRRAVMVAVVVAPLPLLLLPLRC
jgi:hypothetical protein